MNKTHISLILIMVLVALIILPARALADGEAWLTNYSYRKQFTITGTSDGVQTNYQLKLTVNRSTGSDSGLTVYLGTKCEADFDDIRFTKADGSTLLDYWIENITGSVATVWVEFDSIPANPSTINFYLYYGYASASAASNGTNTFVLFDDFADGSVNAMWATNGSITESGTTIVMVGGASGAKVYSASAYNLENKRIKLRGKVTAGKTHDAIQIDAATYTTDFSDTDKGQRQFLLYDAASTYYVANEKFANVETNTASSVAHDTDTYHNFEVIRKTNGTQWILDNVSVKTSSNDPNVNEYIVLMRTWEAATRGYTVDWFFESNWTPNDPTITTWASEETPVPTVTTSAASNITMDYLGVTGGKFNGELTSLGDDTGAECSFQYGLTNSYGSETSPVAYNSTTVFEKDIPNDLLPGNTYYFRSKATNIFGTSYGSGANFTLTMPTFTTADAIYTSPGSATATLAGNLTNMGVASNATVYYQWGYDTGYGTNTADQIFSIIDDVTQAISGFLRNATVHFRAAVEIGSNTSYGSDQTFLIASGDLGEVLWYQPIAIIQGTTLPDRDSTEDGIITWGTNPAGITVTPGPFGPGVQGGHEAKAPPYALGGTGNFITDPPVPTGSFSNTTAGSSWWGFDIWRDVAATNSTPIQLILLIVSGFVILAISLTSSWIMKRFGSGTHFVKAGIIFGLMGMCTALSLYDWWMIVIFAVIAIALSWMSQQRGVT